MAKPHSISCISKLSANLKQVVLNSRLANLKRYFSIGAAMACLHLLAACSLDAGIESISRSTSEILATYKPTSNELVSASQQNVVTAQGYRVQSSFSFQDGKGEVITAKGYKVYTNSQSSLFKE